MGSPVRDAQMNIFVMRDLHAELDRAILACYGWQEVDLGHDFHVNERGQTRFTISPPGPPGNPDPPFKAQPGSGR